MLRSAYEERPRLVLISVVVAIALLVAAGFAGATLDGDGGRDTIERARAEQHRAQDRVRSLTERAETAERGMEGATDAGKAWRRRAERAERRVTSARRTIRRLRRSLRRARRAAND